MEQNVSPALTAARNWPRAGMRRRAALLSLVLVPTAGAAALLYSLLPRQDGVFLNALLTTLFAMLFAWIAVGFWSAVAGLVLMCRRFDRFNVAASGDGGDTPLTVRSAILFPVHNEDARRVREGVRAVWRSLRTAGHEKSFDIFLLSDSTSPDAWVNEEEAWHRLCLEEEGFDHIFYRHRTVNRKGKIGNIADFCRRWGAKYPYMIVFDADSVMSGDTLARMVRIMEKRPDIGILQTAPKSINSRSLIARIQQFSNHLYGSAFAAGLHYWQLGDAQYWGHNAIIRTGPFMRHCHLPVLSGPKPLGGPILSHDFVEAALMRRAGYGVWLAHDLGGSFEENPPTLIDELVRDRRWCQGNLQHGRLVLAHGFYPTQRALFVNGIMSYVSALLWFFFLVASSLQAVAELFLKPDYFPKRDFLVLFPEWPQYFTQRILGLMGATMILLFLPKLMVAALTVIRGEAGRFGGVTALIGSVVGEVAVSALLAPVRMVYHSMFVVTTLVGFTVRWGTQNRDSESTGWRDAIRFHWWGTAFGLAWGAVMFVLNPNYFYWLSPIVVGLAISIPLSVWTSRTSLGGIARRFGLFLTPAETAEPQEVAALNAALRRRPASGSPLRPEPEEGFVRSVVMPRTLSLHVSLNRRPHAVPEEKRMKMDALVARAETGGPDALTNAEKNTLLHEPDFLHELHRRVWRLEPARAAAWGIQRFK